MIVVTRCITFLLIKLTLPTKQTPYLAKHLDASVTLPPMIEFSKPLINIIESNKIVN
jgi:hypothetical protein